MSVTELVRIKAVEKTSGISPLGKDARVLMSLEIEGFHYETASNRRIILPSAFKWPKLAAKITSRATKVRS